MNRSSWRIALASLLAGVAIGAGGAAQAQQAAATPPLSPAARANADHGIPPYTPADVHFMQGMIGHHSQAVVMAAWAPTHGAGSAVRVLAQRIDVSQRDEIVTMQTWLRQRHESVPDDHMATMAGMTLMPGMLTPQQMAQLDSARGPEFDRLFMTFMIQHHTGALTMVEALFDSPGAGQDDAIFKFATDVAADQTAEIDRMQSMLAAR